MRLSKSYFVTKKENLKDDECVSSNLLVRAGMIKKVGSGIYAFLPMGLRVFRKIENVVREEMNNIGSQELVMPSLLPEDYYIDSGRRSVFGDDMFSLKDRVGRDYVLGPTHEELFVEVCRDMIKSYKDMPISLYQMANKYRDEPRSRYGLIRTREFVMKDAYTFDKDLDGLDESYKLMFNAYKKIFDRIGVDYRIVRASTGAMGGLLSEEFQAITDIGEDIVVTCDNCGFSTNIEICDVKSECEKSNEEEKEKELLHTPNCGTINDLYENYGIDSKNTCKTMIYKVDGKFYAFMVRGDREVNEYKISRLLNAVSVEMATAKEDEKITGANVGFAGPIDLEIPVIIDNEVLCMKNFLVGANKSDYHYINTNLRDFKYEQVADIRNVCEEDKCPECGHDLSFKHGIEVGNTFKLGTKYSESMGLYFADENNKLKPVYMGSYGIGVARIMAAIVEQNHDEDGIIFPEIIAPYDLAIVVVNSKDKTQMKVANELYEKYKNDGVEVILDDRDVRAGVKFKDMDLIGIPKRIVVGKKATDGIVELKYRNSSDVEEIYI
jgi:prolyl-tRNA synthetase